MKSQATPGPWEADQEGVIFSIEDGTSICSTYPRNREANARLIAAAPDLLAALEVLTKHAQEVHPYFKSCRGQADIQAALDAIAITKAKGETPC